MLLDFTSMTYGMTSNTQLLIQAKVGIGLIFLFHISSRPSNKSASNVGALENRRRPEAEPYFPSGRYAKSIT